MADMTNSFGGPTPLANAYGVSAPSGAEAGLERSLRMLEQFKGDNPQWFSTSGGFTNDPVKNIQALTNKPFSLGESYRAPGYEEPIVFSKEAVNFDRYYSHPSFNKLGFNPLRDNETFYNENSHWTEDYARMGSQFGKLFGAGFVGTYETIGDIFQGENFSYSDDISRAYEKASNIGSSTRGGLVGFGNNLLLNSAYTFGIITDYFTTELALAGLTYLSGGAAAPATGAAAVGKTAAFTKALGGVWDIYKASNSVKRVTTAIDAAQDVSKLKRFWQATVSGLNPLENTMQFAKELAATEGQIYKMTNLAKTTRGFGAFYKDVKAASMTWSESKLEAGMVEQEVKDELINKFINTNGRAPVGGEMQDIEEKAYAAANTTALTNAPLIYATNEITFGTLFKGYTPLADAAEIAGEGVLGRFTRKTAEKGKILFEKKPGAFKAAVNFAKKPSLKAATGYVTTYASGNFSEGIQEIGQEIISATAKDYYTHDVNDPGYASAASWSASLAKAAKEQYSAQGLETFLSGFLMGGVVTPVSKAAYQIPALAERIRDPKGYAEKQQAREKEDQKILDALNEVGNDVDSFYNNLAQAFGRARKIGNNAMEAGLNNDQLAQQHAKDAALFEKAYMLMRTGAMNEHIKYLSDLKKLSFQEIKEAIPQLSSRTEEETRTKVDKVINRMEELAKDFIAIEKEVKNPYKPSLYAKGTPEYEAEVHSYHAVEEAKRQMLFYKHAIKRHFERNESIINEVKNNPAVAKTAYTDWSVMFDEDSLKNEIEVLKKETVLETQDEEQLKILNNKKERLQILQEMQESIEKSKTTRKDGSVFVDRRKLNYIQPAYEKFLAHLSKTTGSPINPENARKTLSLIFDSKTLVSSAADLQGVYNILADPAGFRDAQLRISEVAKALFEERKAKSQEIFDRTQLNEKQKAFVENLAKAGIVIAPEEIEAFLEKNVRPTKFYSVNSTELLTPQDPEYMIALVAVAGYYNQTKTADKKESSGTSTEAATAAAQAEKAATVKEDLSEAVENLDPYFQNAVYALYDTATRNEKEPMSFQEWELTPAGENAVRALTELQEMYTASNTTDSVNQWVEDNKGSSKVRETLIKYNLNLGTITGLFADPNVFVSESRPSGYDLETQKGDNGLFILSTTIGTDESATKAYYLVDNRSNFVGEKAYKTLEEAQEEKRKLAQTYEAENQKFIFGGVIFYAGQIVNNGRGITYKVVTTRKEAQKAAKNAEENPAVKPILKLQVVEDLNNPSRVGAFEEKTYVSGNQRLIPGQYKDFEATDQYKILDLWKYTKIYAARTQEDLETAAKTLNKNVDEPEVRSLADKLAEKRLKDLLENTPAEELAKRLGVKISKNKNWSEGYLTVDGKFNPHVKERREKIAIGITLDGEVIGYSRSIQNVQFLDAEGNTIPYYEAFKNSLILRRVFKYQGEGAAPIAELRSKANAAFYQAFRIYELANNALNGQDEITLSPEETNNMFGSFAVGEGSYAFADTETVTMSELQYSTIEGGYYIIDRANTAKGGEARGARKTGFVELTTLKGEARKRAKAKIEAALEASPNQLDNRGRYILAVEMPNGKVRFVSLKAPVINEDTQSAMLQGLTTLAQDAQKNGTNPTFSNVEANKDIIDGKTYIALGRGQYARLRVNRKGNLTVELSDNLGMSGSVIIESNRDLINTPFTDINDLVEHLNDLVNSKRDTIKNYKINKINFKVDSFRTSISQGAQAKQLVDLNMETDVKPEIVDAISFRVKPLAKEKASVAGSDVQEKSEESQFGDIRSILEEKKRKAEEAQKASQEAKPDALNTLSQLGRESASMAPPQEAQTNTETLVKRRNELNRSLQDVRNAVRKELLANGVPASEVIARRDTDERVTSIVNEIAEIESKLGPGSAKKIVRKPKRQYTEQDAVKIDEFIDWVNKNLPRSISVQQSETLRENLHNGNITVGEFIMSMTALAGGIQRISGKIRVGANTPFKYHEAFHAVFRMLLTEEEIQKYLAIAKKEVADKLRSAEGYKFAGSNRSYKTLKGALAAMRKMDPMYMEMSEQELENTLYEEYLADQFDSWKKNIKTPTSPTNKSLFARIVDIIVNLFTKGFKANTYTNLFQEIENGKYSSADIQSNRFTDLIENGAPVVLALKTLVTGQDYITVGGKLRKVNKYFAGDASMKLITGIAVAKFKIDTEPSEYSRLSDEEKYNKIFEDFEKHYDYQDEAYVVRDDYEYIESILRDYNTVLVENRAELIDAAEEYLKALGYNTEEVEDALEAVEDDLGPKEAEQSSTESRKEKHTIGGMKSLSGWVRLYIQSTTVPQGAFGRPIEADSYAVNVINGAQIYNGLLHVLEGTTDMSEQLIKLSSMLPLANSSRPSATSLFVKKLFADFNIQVDDTNNILTDAIVNPSKLAGILKAFQKFRVDYKFFSYDPQGGVIRVINANQRDDSKTQFEYWRSAFYSTVNYRGIDATYSDTKTALEDIAAVVSEGTEKDLDAFVELSDNLYNASGIYLEPMYLRYSTLTNSQNRTAEETLFVNSIVTEPLSLEGINAIIANLSKKEDPFTRDGETEEQNDFSGSAGRIQKIASGNVTFNDSVGATSFVNADNEIVYGHQIPTYELRRARELRNFSKPEVIGQEDAFVQNNMLLEMPEFMAMLPEFSISRVDGLKIQDLGLEEGEAFRKNTARNKSIEGTTFTRFTNSQYIHTMLSMYLSGTGNVMNKKKTYRDESGLVQTIATAFINLGVIESTSTMDIAEMPVVPMVKLDGKKVVLTEQGIAAITKLVKSEYDNITAVQNQINGTEPYRVIDGYHTGDQRGLKFIDMIAVLQDSELISALETAAKEGVPFEEAIAENPINGSINDFFRSTVDSAIDVMRDAGMIKAEGIVSKAGIPYDIINGVTVQKKTETTDGIVDTERTALLNLLGRTEENKTVPSSLILEHNLSQVIMNSFVSTQALNNLMYGHTGKLINPKKVDVAEISKEFVKRNKSRQTGGPTADSMLIDPSKGINHTTESVDVLTLEDESYLSVFTGTEQNPKFGDKTDAQMFLTTKTFRHFMFSFGKLDADLAEMIDAVESGKEISADRYFGNDKVKGHVQFKNSMISLKLAYTSASGDTQGYIKTSAFVLSPRLTSINAQTAYPGREKLHELRLALEERQGKEGLAAAAFKSASKGATSLNEFTTFAAKNFVLQQENPSNKKKITNPSQVAQTVESDIPDDAAVFHRGDKKTAGELKKRHSLLSGARLRLKYNEALSEVFPKGASSADLGRLADRIREILISTGASPKEIEIFSRDENGNLKANLNNVTVEDRFVQMYLTFMVNNTFREKIPGHALTLVSNYGLKVVKRATGKFDEKGHPIGEVVRDSEVRSNPSLYANLKDVTTSAELASGIKEGDLYMDELRHNVPVYNQKGEIVDRYTEVMMPPQSYDAAAYLKKGKIPEAVARLFGVRIPSQDKHSSVSIRVVDFLPVEYGSVIVSPHELIEISGADFDIDKLYAASANYFYNQQTKEFEAYGDVTNDEDRFRHFVHYMFANNKDFRKAYAEFKELPVNLSDFTINNLEDLGSLAETLKDNNVKNALKSLGYPSTASEYAAAYKTFGYDLYEGALDTEIMQLKTALTFNDYTSAPRKEKTGDNVKDAAPAFQVAHVDPLKNEVKLITDELTALVDLLEVDNKEELKESVANLFTEKAFQHNTFAGMIYARKNNKEGAVNIGSAVRSLLSWNFLQKHDVEAKSAIYVGDSGEAYYSDYGNPFTRDGQRKGYIISALVSAMTDNAKERLAAILGLNIEALGHVAHMVAVGVSLNEAVLFVNQPVIRRYYKEQDLARDEFSRETKSLNPYDILVKSILVSGKPAFANAQELELAMEGINSSYDTRDLKERLISNVKGDSNLDHDLQIAKAFINLQDTTKQFLRISAVSGIVKGIGDSTEENFDGIYEDYMAIIKESDSNNYSNMEAVFNSDPYMKEALSILKDMRDRSRDVLVRRTPRFIKLKKSILDSMAVKSYKKEEFSKKLTRDLVSYFDIVAYQNYLKKEGRLQELQYTLSNSLLYYTEGMPTIVDYVEKLREDFKDAGKTNEFLDKFIHTFSADSVANKSGFDYIESNTWSKIEPIQLQRLQAAFVELYNQDPIAATAISNYILVKDGGQFKSGSISNVIPFVLQEEFHFATQGVRALLNNDDAQSSDFVNLFGKSEFELMDSFVRNYMKHATISNKNYGASLYLRKIPMYKDPKDAPKSIKISEDGTISVNIFEGLSKGELLKYEKEGLEFVERAGLTEDQKQDNKEAMKKTFKELMKVGFIPNDGDARGFFAPTALMYNNEVYYLESNAFSGKVKPQINFEYYLPLGTEFTYKKGDSYGTAKTTPIGFVFGSVPTTTEILEVKRERRAERQGTAIPAEMNTTQEPVQKSIERAPEVSTQGSPRDILANNGIAFTIDPVNGFTYFDEQGNVIGKYRNMIPAKVVEQLAGATKAVVSTDAKADIEVVSRYSDAEVKANPDKIYVFGDNTERKGTAGQAQIRNNENAFGIATKIAPNNSASGFMSDDQLQSNKAVIDADIAKIKADGRPIVFPKDGFGTGLAKLKEKAPKTYDYLKQRLQEEFGFNNDTGEVLQGEENSTLPNSPVNALTLELKDVLDDKASFMEYVIGQGVPQDKAELIWKGAQAVKTAPQKMRMNFVQNSIEKHKTCE